MIILGLLLIAAAVVAAVDVVGQNRTGIDVRAFGHTWHHVSAFWLAVAGAAVLLVAIIGLRLLRGGAARSRRRRRERRQSASERRDLAAENRRLAERAERAEATPAQSAQAAPDQPTGQNGGHRSVAPNGSAPTDNNSADPNTAGLVDDSAGVRHRP